MSGGSETGGSAKKESCKKVGIELVEERRMSPDTPEQHALLFPKLSDTYLAGMRRMSIVRQTRRGEMSAPV